MIEQLSTLWTLRKISDFIKKGVGVWYHVDSDNNIVFYDGEKDPQENRHPIFQSFR